MGFESVGREAEDILHEHNDRISSFQLVASYTFDREKGVNREQATFIDHEVEILVMGLFDHFGPVVPVIGEANRPTTRRTSSTSG